MNSIFDTLFLRRPRIEYVSPPICEAIFSSSGHSIFLEPIEHIKSPTGLVWSNYGFRFFTWPAVVGQICVNVYRTLDPNNPASPYNLIAECVPPGVIAVCSAGSWTITSVTQSGESAPSSPIVTDGSGYVFIPLTQVAGQICNNLYKDGKLLWACFGGNSFEVCGCAPACYRVSTITEDGETQLSEPICYSGEVAEQTCPPNGWAWDPDQCLCIPCDVQVCPDGQYWAPAPDCACVGCEIPGPCGPGEHWDVAQCKCISGSGCSGFLDDLVPTPYALFKSAGEYVFFSDNSQFFPRFYNNRIVSPDFLATFSFVMSCNAAGKCGGDIGGNGAFWYDAVANDFRTISVSPFEFGGGLLFMDSVGNGVGYHTVGSVNSIRFYDSIGNSSFDIIDPIQDFSSQPKAMADGNFILADTLVGESTLQGHIIVRRYRNGAWDTLYNNGFPDTTAPAGVAINNSGAALYYWFDGFVYHTMFVDPAGAQTDIAQDSLGFGTAMNNSNWVIISSSVPQLWRPGIGLISIPLLPGSFSAAIVGVTDTGVVYGSSDTGVAFIWTAAGGTRTVLSLLPTGTGWTSVDTVYAATDTNLLTISGVHSGNPAFGVVRICL